MLRRASRVVAKAALVVGGVAGAASYAASYDVWALGVGERVRKLDAERAHRLAVLAAKWHLAAPGLRLKPPPDDEMLRVKLWGMQFSNPIGLAAGFDKDAEAMTGLFAIGFGFVEIGTVTPLPQRGNDRPRVWRLEEDHALINRYGFNSAGAAVVGKRLCRYNGYLAGVLGVNVGKNRDTENAVDDYLTGVRTLGDLADYIVVNVSSPNTAGLRDLQAHDALRDLLKTLQHERDLLMYKAPLLVKIAPDLDEKQQADIADVVLQLGVDGLVVCNTTLSRDGLQSDNKANAGGLSGAPLEERATKLVANMYRLTDGRVPIVGVGGVASAQDAYRKIRAGASLVQLYTALVYQGPWMVDRMKCELIDLLRADGFKTVEEAVGADHRIKR